MENLICTFVVVKKNGYIKIKTKGRMENDMFCDLVKRIENNFMEIDSDIMVDLRKQDTVYLSYCQQLGELEKMYPFILQVTEEKGEISLTKEEHEILVEYFKIALKKDNIERKQIYFHGHTDGYAYLKKINAL